MNLGQVIDCHAVAEAQKPAPTPGQSLEEGRRLGTVRVVKHLAIHDHVPGADVEPTPGAPQSVTVQARAAELLAALKESGKPLRKGDLVGRTRILDRNFEYAMQHLMKDGRVTRAGGQGRLLMYGLPEWRRNTRTPRVSRPGKDKCIEDLRAYIATGKDLNRAAFIAWARENGNMTGRRFEKLWSGWHEFYAAREQIAERS